MNRKELIAKARANRMKAKAAETDSRGVQEIGGAPDPEITGKPAEDGEIEQQLDTATGDQPSAPAADAPIAPAEAAPPVAITDSSAVALVKMTEQMNDLSKETEINEAVIKRFNDMMKAAGLPVAAMQKLFNARGTMVNRLSTVEAKRQMDAVSKAKLVLKAMEEEVDLTPEDKTDLDEIKILLEMAVEKTEDAIAEVVAGRIGDHRNIIANAMRDAQAATRQYAFWKKNLDFKDSVIDSITAVQEFVTARKIPADMIFNEFDSLVSMSAPERRNIKAWKMANTPNFVSQGIQSIAGYNGRDEEKPKSAVERIGDLAMEVINGEKVVIDRV